MSADIVVIILLCVLAYAAHGATTQVWLQWTLRVIYCFAFFGELGSAISGAPPAGAEVATSWSTAVMWVMAIFTLGLLFRPFRRGVSYVLTPINQLISGQVFYAIAKKLDMKAIWLSERVFIADSYPHMNALWVYVTVLGLLLAMINPQSFQMPSIAMPFPVPLDALFSYNFLGLVMLSFAGAGVFLRRKPLEAMARLGLVKPAGWQIGIGLLMIPVTFLYDYLWSLHTGTPASGVGQKLAQYNAGTFAAGGGAGPAAILALFTGICAGIGEETLMRGGLQPVFGILPAGILHGVLHSQFQNTPILILQVAGWSVMMGIVRRYTNTTTTIITHASYNFLTTFLFAFNP